MKRILFCFAAIFPFCLVAQNVFKLQPGSTIKTTVGIVITLQDMDLNNDGTISQSLGEGSFRFSGSQNNSISGTAAPLFDVIEIAKTGNAKISLNHDINVGSSINFTSGLIDLNNNNILLQSSALLNGENENSRITGVSGGYIEITKTLNAPSTSNPGNLGAIITSSQNLGSTTIRRGHRSQTNGLGGGNSVLRYFDILPSNNSSLNATFRFQYLDAELNGLDENSIVFWKSTDNIHWTNQGFTSRNTSTNYVEKTGIPDLSRWTLSTVNNPLPITFILFNAKCDGDKISLHWKTAQESGSSYFEVQRSRDGINWTSIGNVAAAGYSDVELTYSFNDITPLPSGSMYRIAEYDLDGKKQYSSIIRSSCDVKEAIRLWPNPATNIVWLNINTPFSTEIQIRMYNTAGSLVLIKEVSLLQGSNQLSISLDKFANGIYELKAEWGIDQMQTFKLIKQ